MAQYKQRCSVCKNKWALVRSMKQRFVVCKECELEKIKGHTIEDKAFKKLFAIPEKLYEENDFLRSIRYQYIRYNSLTERQLEAFKKAVKELKKEKKK